MEIKNLDGGLIQRDVEFFYSTRIVFRIWHKVGKVRMNEVLASIRYMQDTQ